MDGSADNYSIDLKASARKELEALPDSVLARAVAKIESLRHNPRPEGCKKLKGFKDSWRVRVGNWRIVYIIDNVKKTVSVTRIAHRSQVYD